METRVVDMRDTKEECSTRFWNTDCFPRFMQIPDSENKFPCETKWSKKISVMHMFEVDYCWFTLKAARTLHQDFVFLQ